VTDVEPEDPTRGANPGDGGRGANPERQRAVQVLYEADLRRVEPAEALRRIIADPNAEPLGTFARSLIRGVAEHIGEIDAVLGQYARGWTVARMPVVDRNVLRLGIFELIHDDRTPPAVVIDEAVELAKSLSTDASPRYVNGVLAAILRERTRRTG
jgi:transcription antitermination protein NusB